MAAYTFPGQAVLANDDILENATGGIFVDDNDTPIPIYDQNDAPISTISSNAFGQSSVFKADVPAGWIKFGSIKNWVVCKEIVGFALNAQNAVSTAAAANTAALQALTTAQQALTLVQQGGAIPAGTTLDAIGDSSTRVAVTPAQKLAIAGLPASYLQLGTSSTQAMRGNTTFSALDVGAVATQGGAQRNWKARPASVGYPTVADGVQEGDTAELYQDS